MKVISSKPKKSKVLLWSIIAIAIIGIVMIISGNISGQCAHQKSLKAATSDEQILFLHTFGWDTEPAPNEIIEISIPAQFDDVYENYNQIQKNQGFDLSEYKGQSVKQIKYTIVNYPDTDEKVYAVILICDDKIIGGDIRSGELGGFMHGFDLKSKSNV